QQRLRERRRARRVDGDDADLAGADVAEHLAERGEVEDVTEALARGLEQHRELRVAGGDVEQVGGALALLPQRRAAAGPTAGASVTRSDVLCSIRAVDASSGYVSPGRVS